MTESLDLPSIAFFSATGFFPGDATYFKNKIFEYSPASAFKNDYQRFADFKWYYQPESVTLKKATEQFAEVFENIIKRQARSNHIILPLSGGLDSRTQAVALKRLGIPTSAYSYSFKNGHNENRYGEQIANKCGFDFKSYIIPEGYLWNKIDELASINLCYSDFTHPRQMAFADDFSKLGDLFSLGHWGDVLFDGMQIADNLSFDEQVNVIIKKITRKGGEQLATSLWNEWGLLDTFKDYFQNTVAQLHKTVFIPENANSSVRAFKSKFWATRWTASNFSVFEKYNPIGVPYFDTEICDFICRTPEQLLNNRQIQIEYIKQYAPELASIKWQSNKPFNLYNYHLNKSPINIPYRILNKLQRTIRKCAGTNLIQRNWELQFIGTENKKQLLNALMETNSRTQFISSSFIHNYFNSFYQHPSPATAHQTGILLTLSKFSKLYLK